MIRPGRLGAHLQIRAMNVNDKVDMLRLSLERFLVSQNIAEQAVSAFMEQFSTMTPAHISDTVFRAVTKAEMQGKEEIT